MFPGVKNNNNNKADYSLKEKQFGYWTSGGKKKNWVKFEDFTSK